ncbi:MAG: hypothetical protein AB7D92_10775 [Sphaerochaeta sp.]
MTNKPLIPLVMIIVVLLMGCTTTNREEGVSALEAENALREVIVLASQAIDANLFNTVEVEVLLPEEAKHFSTLQEIPLFLDHLESWQEEVLQALRVVLVQTPALLETYMHQVAWEHPQAALIQGDQSASRELRKQQGEAIKEEITVRLQDALKPSNEIWDLLLERYGIWQKGTLLWGERELEEVNTTPLEHLSTLFLETYYEELANQEERLRTTPVPKGSGSLLELFQQDVKP